MRSVPLLALLLVVAFAPRTTSGQTVKAGVVSALEGNVTTSRAAVPQPIALRFRDDVYVQDRITAGDRSLVRLLLGGKAVVTLRERSSVTITERPDRSTVTLESGKIAVVVARERMRPGEAVEVRTPNAVAAVRGTVLIAEVTRTAAQSPPSAVPVQTSFFVFGGSVEAQVLTPAGTMSAPFVLSPSDMVVLTGTPATPPSVRPMTAAERTQASAGLRPTQPQHTSSLDQSGVRATVSNETLALVSALTGSRESPGPTASGTEPAGPTSNSGSTSNAGPTPAVTPAANVGTTANVGPTANIVPTFTVTPALNVGPISNIAPITRLGPTTAPINPCTQNPDICAPRPTCEQDPQGCAAASAVNAALDVSDSVLRVVGSVGSFTVVGSAVPRAVSPIPGFMLTSEDSLVRITSGAALTLGGSGMLVGVYGGTYVVGRAGASPGDAGVILITEGGTLTQTVGAPLVDFANSTLSGNSYLLVQAAGSVVSLNGPLVRATDTFSISPEASSASPSAASSRARPPASRSSRSPAAR
ncbi:MAG: FecR domain-containing protein [Candidatus Rokubacteria bacterium]|nr:FecR domain-containing protein [Candidatus Rokubacteria bacterium]